MIKLLHVDDESDILEIAKISLEMHGSIEVTPCISGEEALRIVEHFTPDIILLDYMMPYLTGPETLQALRKVPAIAEVPVVFMTARAHAEEHKELWSLGALDVIKKPFDPLTLAQKIEAAVAKSVES